MLSVIQLHPKVLKSAECGSFFKIGGSRSGPKIDHFQIFPSLDFPAPETRLRQYKFKLCESSHFQTISSPIFPRAKASSSPGPRWGMGVRTLASQTQSREASIRARKNVKKVEHCPRFIMNTTPLLTTGDIFSSFRFQISWPVVRCSMRSSKIFFAFHCGVRLCWKIGHKTIRLWFLNECPISTSWEPGN